MLIAHVGLTPTMYKDIKRELIALKVGAELARLDNEWLKVLQQEKNLLSIGALSAPEQRLRFVRKIV